MIKNVFTNEDMEVLRENRYTYKVTPYMLQFTREFKALFWKEYQQGSLPRQILEKYGYPADMLGKERIWGITQVIKKQHASQDGLREGRRPRARSKPKEGGTTEEQVKQLQGEVQYLRQEIEFLKKISSIRTTGK